MEIEEKLNPIVEKVVDDIDGLSHWEQMLVLEMTKQSLNAIWLSQCGKEGAFR